jgi:hypothetical protein
MITMTDYPPEKWIPLLLERTAELMDKVAILYSVLKTSDAWKNLPEKTRDEIEDHYFTYHCNWAYSQARQDAVMHGTLREFDERQERQQKERLTRAENLLTP